MAGAAAQALASDLPRVWDAPSATQADRKELLRILIEKITVAVAGTSELADVTITWAGGHQTTGQAVRPVARLDQLSYYPALLTRVTELAGAGRTNRQIADVLNAEGFRPRDGQDSADLGGVLGGVQGRAAEQGADRGQPGVAGGNGVGPPGLQVGQERGDQRGVQVGDVQLAGLLADLPGEEILRAVLAGVELGEWDRRIVAWMASWDMSTVLTVASWIGRARQAGPRE